MKKRGKYYQNKFNLEIGTKVFDDNYKTQTNIHDFFWPRHVQQFYGWKWKIGTTPYKYHFLIFQTICFGWKTKILFPFLYSVVEFSSIKYTCFGTLNLPKNLCIIQHSLSHKFYPCNLIKNSKFASTIEHNEWYICT